ncbi:MAG: type VI secretion system contractile sheath large subunit [Deltaproteobacteria bacterium]|nr:type VI secretion system contractile sheath large subunit [Deltaproteobacteria bacterium]
MTSGNSCLEGLLADLSDDGKESLVKALAFALPMEPNFADLNRTLLEIDGLVAGLDSALGRQLDAILHHPDFLDVERTWRSLKYLVDRADSRENIEVYLLDAQKSEVCEDFSEAPEIIRSSMFRKIYSMEYGQFGGQPYGVIIGAYELSSQPEDLSLMRAMANLGALAHAPFVVSVAADFFGLKSWGELMAVQDLEAILSQPNYSAWQALRNQENSRYLALVMPGFLTRIPYNPRSRRWPGFNYDESTEAETSYVWGYSSVLMGVLMAKSFAKYRWCTNVTGLDGGGLIEGLESWHYESMGRVQSRIPLEARIGERMEQTLANSGFISVSLRENPSQAAVYSAPTVLIPKSFRDDTGGGEEASFNYLVSTILPYMMIVNRLAHYIKVIQRENIGTWKDRQVIEKELNAWLNQYVTDMDSPSPELRGRRPLRQARVEVRDVPGVPGWRQMALYVRPHLTFMGASFTLSLVGRLDEVDFVVR